MTAPTDTLRPAEQRAIEALLAGATPSATAAAAGISERTLRRWCQRPHFADALSCAQRSVFDDALRLLRVTALDAVRALRTVLNDQNAPPASRVAAARVVLEQAHRARELEEIEERIAALEEIAAMQTRKGRQ